MDRRETMKWMGGAALVATPGMMSSVALATPSVPEVIAEDDCVIRLHRVDQMPHPTFYDMWAPKRPSIIHRDSIILSRTMVGSFEGLFLFKSNSLKKEHITLPPAYCDYPPYVTITVEKEGVISYCNCRLRYDDKSGLYAVAGIPISCTFMKNIRVGDILNALSNEQGNWNFGEEAEIVELLDNGAIRVIFRGKSKSRLDAYVNARPKRAFEDTSFVIERHWPMYFAIGSLKHF